jgi:hypothetical protein
MTIRKGISLVLLIWISISIAFSQEKAYISGYILDENERPLFSASVAIEGTSYGTVTDEEGYFELEVPGGSELELVVFFLGYETYRKRVRPVAGQTISVDHTLSPEIKVLDDVEVTGVRSRENTLVPINIKSISQLPNASQNIEAIIKTMQGVTSGNELSSMYSVRGGSFDENLVYVNNIEIHRPLLVQSAQQEGLSFVNPSLVSSIQFSAGGFDAEYGDKLSSVLDIRYKQPTGFAGSAMASLLGGSAHAEGATRDQRFTHVTGIRYKRTQYLLGTLDTKGDYSPSFTDFQTYLTFDINRKLELSFLGNYATNKFQRIPSERSTDFGTFQQGFNFTVYYEGQELDNFNNYLGAFTLNYKPKDKTSLKFIFSAYNSNEEVSYDLLRQYWISLATQGSGGSRDSLINIGIGSTLDHARDQLTATIYSAEHRGTYFSGRGVMKWGVKAQQELIHDVINEWILIDSAGVSLPWSDESVELFYTNKSEHNLNTFRFSAFLQHTFVFSLPANEVSLTIGARTHYWTYNSNFFISPRTNLSLQPEKFPNLNFHFAAGLYYQPPFYKELKDPAGIIYPDTKSQRALHLVGGYDYKFQAWRRPFIFSSEIYYKHLTQLIPYKLDDVRLNYLPGEQAKGYAAGIDFKVYGEFVPGLESWFSLSLLSTKEDIYNDYYAQLNGKVIYPGYYDRPTQQWVSFSVFFQDYLPSNPDYKVHLLLIYGSGLPYGGPLASRPSQTYPLGPYRRIDIGFSRVIVRNTQKKMGVESIWLSAEILNLLGAQNKVSYDWMRTVESDLGVNLYFAVPNYLTGRIFNAKISVNF